MDRSTAHLLHSLVYAMDQAADAILRDKFGLSYKRARFLLVLKQLGTVSQHELATTLGYSDPSVSVMLGELEKTGYVAVVPSTTHGRKRLVSLTSVGYGLVTEGEHLLDAHFDKLIADSGIDITSYTRQTKKLYEAVALKQQRK